MQSSGTSYTISNPCNIFTLNSFLNYLLNAAMTCIDMQTATAGVRLSVQLLFYSASHRRTYSYTFNHCFIASVFLLSASIAFSAALLTASTFCRWSDLGLFRSTILSNGQQTRFHCQCSVEECTIQRVRPQLGPSDSNHMRLTSNTKSNQHFDWQMFWSRVQGVFISQWWSLLDLM